MDMQYYDSNDESENDDQLEFEYEAYLAREDGPALGVQRSEGAGWERERVFDISLVASHRYMASGGSELLPVVSRSVLEPGVRVRVPCMVHSITVFPGETVPLLLPPGPDAYTLDRIVAADGLFVLLSLNPRRDKRALSGSGVVCEVFEADAAGEGPRSVRRVSARALAHALHRCKLVTAPDAPESEQDDGYARLLWYNRLRCGEVEVLPELAAYAPLHAGRLASLDQRRPHSGRAERWVRALDALVTPWPLFVYDFFDEERMRETIKNHFRPFGLESSMPEKVVDLSFWVARNMSLDAYDMDRLFHIDHAILRLHMECSLMSRTAVVCCGGCRLGLAHRSQVIRMSSSGVHGTFANPHGHMHDLVTTHRAVHVRAHGPPSDEFSWFPGYAWTVLSCARCQQHVGWRFDAINSTLRPRRFYGLCRNYKQDDENAPSNEAAPTLDAAPSLDATPSLDVAPFPLDAMPLHEAASPPDFMSLLDRLPFSPDAMPFQEAAPFPLYAMPLHESAPPPDVMPTNEAATSFDAVPSLAFAPSHDDTPRLDAAPSLNSASSLDVAPPLDATPSQVDAPRLEAAASLDAVPSLDATPSLDAAPLLHVAPPLDAAPSQVNTPSLDAAPSLTITPSHEDATSVDSGPRSSLLS